MRRRRFGAVRKLPSGRWQASYPHNGRRISGPKTFPTKTAATDWLTTVEADLLRGRWQDPKRGSDTLRDYSVTWVDSRTRLAARTRELYGHLLKRHILPTLGDQPLKAIDTPMIRSWYSELAARHPSTAAKAYRLLSSIFKSAVVDDGSLDRSPCTIRGAGTEPKRKWMIVEEDDARRVLDALPEHLVALAVAAAWMDLRRGELLGLRWGDVDLRSGTLTVGETRTPLMAGGLVVKAPKSDAGRRAVAMPGIVVEALKSHRGVFHGHAKDDLVFRGKKGGVLHPQVLWKTFDRARTEAGLTGLRLHDLRHSGLTWYAREGATIAELMYRGGHSTPASAMHYQHHALERDRQIASRLGRR